MQSETPSQLFAQTALTSHGWQQQVLVDIGSDGTIASVTANASCPAGVKPIGLLLPGIANVHSHAFQRAMAGLAEQSGGNNDDNFWSWRQVMYRFKQRLTPEHIESIARYLYIELLKQGYTAIGEFHYMHHDAQGLAYFDASELSQRIIAAASASGIHLTLLPVYYETSNFGGVPANDGQKRFIHNVDEFLKLLSTLTPMQHSDMNLGIAPHSLRAVPPESLARLLSSLASLGLSGVPVHMHVSEQTKEVDDCLAWSSKRPAQWLLDNAPLDARWCLIHATHTTSEELQTIAASKAVIGLCPTTEANLGDGVFNAEYFLQQQGRFAIGSDSNVCTSPWEELRQMEYAQRLATRRRDILCSETVPSVGNTLYTKAASGGAQALGIRTGAIEPGARADLIAIDNAHPMLHGKSPEDALNTLIFGMQQPPVSDVWVHGRQVIANGRHALEDQSAAAMKAAMTALVA